MNINKKVCIGLANFDKDYGITNKLKKQQDLTSFFNFLIKKKIKFLDTALGYQKAENRLFKLNFNFSSFKIVTKIPKPTLKKNFEKDIIKKILISKKKLKIKKFYAILLHDTLNLKKEEFKKVFNIFKILKKKKLTDHTGLSLYNLSDFKKIIQFYKPNIIQIPLNVFDREFLDKSFLSLVKKYKIKLHIRSIFLQGVLLSNKKFFTKNFSQWQKNFEMWENYCNSLNKDKLFVATNFILNENIADKIVVGFHDVNEIKKFLKVKQKKLKIPKFFDSNNKDLKLLTKPYNW